MRKNYKWWVGGIVLFFAIFVFVYSNFAKNEQDAITQGELAKMLSEKMNIEVNQAAGAKGYIRALEQRGISPAEGWKTDKPITTKDLDNIFVGVGRLQAEVAGGKDPQSVLKEVGVVLPGAINRKTVNDILEEPNVKRLLETPFIAGPSIPYPAQDLSQGEGKQVKPPPAPPAETPSAPAVPEEVTPSSGGGT